MQLLVGVVSSSEFIPVEELLLVLALDVLRHLLSWSILGLFLGPQKVVFVARLVTLIVIQGCPSLAFLNFG